MAGMKIRRKIALRLDKSQNPFLLSIEKTEILGMDSGWSLRCSYRSTHNNSLSKSIEGVSKKRCIVQMAVFS